MAANGLSVLSSSFTILFLFWSITHLAKRLSGRTSRKAVQQWRSWALVGVRGLHIQRFVWFSA